MTNFQPTLTGSRLIPGRPHLDREKRGPADDVCHDYHKSHFHCGYLCLGDELDAAHPGQGVVLGCFGRQVNALLPFGFQFEILPYFEADQPVTNAQDGHWDDVDGETDPCDVSFGPPGLHKVAPAVVHS